MNRELLVPLPEPEEEETAIGYSSMLRGLSVIPREVAHLAADFIDLQAKRIEELEREIGRLNDAIDDPSGYWSSKADPYHDGGRWVYPDKEGSA